MATVTAGTLSPIRMNQVDLLVLADADYVERTSTLVETDAGEGLQEYFRGSGFTYDADGDPSGGRLTSWEQLVDGNRSFLITDIDIAVTDFVALLVRPDATAFIRLFYGGDDRFIGGPQDDYIDASNGHDIVTGGDGADQIFGGMGNDHLYGQSSNGGPDGGDYIDGGTGGDYIQGNAGDDLLDGNHGSDRIFGGQGNDQIDGRFDNDTINGNLGNDRITGGGGNDSVRGGQGDDLILGNEGNDLLLGDLGNDTLSGGEGSNTLIGGNGADLFDFFYFDHPPVSNYTTIADFADGQDHIALSSVWGRLEAVPDHVLRGHAQATIAQAQVEAQRLFDMNSEPSNDVAAVAVGADTFIFYGWGNPGQIDSMFCIAGVSPGQIGVSDFISYSHQAF